MRTNNVFSGRPAYYDRNPSNGTAVANLVGGAPHANTTRATYTVPSARKAILSGGYLRMHRVTAAGTLGETRQYLLGGSGGIIQINDFINNTVDFQQFVNFAISSIATAGQSFIIQDFDGGIGGTVDYNGTLEAIEFDA